MTDGRTDKAATIRSPFREHKNLDPSYKMDLYFWDCVERVKLVL